MSENVSSSLAMDSALQMAAGLMRWFRTKHVLMPIVVFTAEQPESATASGADRTGSVLPPSTDDSRWPRRLFGAPQRERLAAEAAAAAAAEQASVSAAEKDKDITALVEAMHRSHLAGKLICCPAKSQLGAPTPPFEHSDDPVVQEDQRRRQYEKAFGLLDEMTKPDNWGAIDLPRSRKPAFPRSNLVKAVEEVSRTDDRERISLLRQNRWRSKAQRDNSRLGTELKPLLDLGSVFSTLLLLALTTYLGGRLRLLLMALSAVFGVVVFYRLVPYLRPQLLWLSRINRWFSKTTFLTTEQAATQVWAWWNPFVSGRVMTMRSRELANDFAKVPRSAGTGGGGGDGQSSGGAGAAPAVRPEPAEQGQPSQERGESANDTRLYLLQFRTLALLEDLRALYLPWRLNLRRRKRPTPPILFLPRATVVDGHVALLGAINDIRCRRSEVDPLLVFAGMSSADLDALNSAQGWSGNSGTPSNVFNEERFKEWISGLRLGQSPQGRPWVLQRVMKDTLFASPFTGPPKSPKEPKRSLWLKLWSLPTLLAVLAAGLGLGIGFGVNYQDHHCGNHRWLYFGNHDLRRVKDVTGNSSECIGVTDEAYPFDTSGFRLDGTTADNPGTGMGHDVTLSTLENWIATSNGSIGNSPHITVVYAGPLSTWQGQQASQMRNGMEELAGVYLAQNYANSGESDGPKVKVLVGNGGQELRREYMLAQQIVSMAEKDPTIVAVVGLGRDVDDSDRTVKLLQRHGLAVVDTTNSSPTLNSNLNYFGLASTDTEEADALVHQLVADTKGGSKSGGAKGGSAKGGGARAGTKSADVKGPKKAFVVARAPAGTDDLYSQQQKAVATEALTAAGYKVVPLPYPAGVDISFAQTIDRICDGTASVVYLAGRSDDVSALLGNITGDAKCSTKKLSLLSGDDLTKLDFVLDNVFVPKGVTVYFAALADPLVTGARSVLVNSVELVPQLSRESDTPSEPATPAAGTSPDTSAPSASRSPAPSATGPSTTSTSTTASTSTTPPESRSILSQQMFDDGTLAMAFEAIEAVQNAADISHAVHSGYRPSVLAGLDMVHLSNQPGGRVEFSRSTQPGDADHGIVVNKVTEQDREPEAVCATPSGTSTKDIEKNRADSGGKILPPCTMTPF